MLDLKAQHQSIREEIRTVIDEVFDSTAFVSGPAVARFEEDFASYLGVPHAMGVSSGTSALHLALLALGIGPGDEVIVPAMSFIATAAAVDYTGARPVIVDIEPATYTLDPQKIETALTEKTKAIIPVHLYGHAADMDTILKIADERNLYVVEDAAQAHGATYNGRPVGNDGHIACFSFFPGKNLGACGEAGAVVTADEALARKVRMMRDWGQEQKGRHEMMGFNYRMDGIQGAVLGVKLRHLDDWSEGRRRVAQGYRDRLKGAEGVMLPAESDRVRHVYHVFALRLGNRDEVRSRLQTNNIASGIHYPCAMHEHPCFSKLGYSAGDFPVAERLAREEISLPIFPELTDDQLDRICDVVLEGT